MNLLLLTDIKTKKVKTYLKSLLSLYCFYRIVMLCDDLHRQL